VVAGQPVALWVASHAGERVVSAQLKGDRSRRSTTRAREELGFLYMNAASLVAELTQHAEPVSSDKVLADIPGWDSLVVVRLVVQLESALGRELEEAELEALERVSDIERLLHGK
jgi:acyl carrier protein